MHGLVIDLIGQKFGRLTVLSLYGRNKHNQLIRQIQMIVVEKKPEQPKRKHGNEEKKIQIECVTFFTNNYTPLKNLLFAVVNETDETSQRERIKGNIRRMTGVRRGVSDLVLSMACRGYHGCYLEAKTLEGSQSDAQMEWQKEVEAQGYCYKIFRSKDEFQQIIEWYIGKPDEALKSQE